MRSLSGSILDLFEHLAQPRQDFTEGDEVVWLVKGNGRVSLEGEVQRRV